MNEEVKEIFKTNKAYKLDDICKKIKTMSKEDIHSCIRITLNGNEEIKELNKFCTTLKKCVETLRGIK